MSAPATAGCGVQVVVVSFEARDALLSCLSSLDRCAPPLSAVTVVDNASTDGSADAVRDRQPAVELIANARNVGFSTACNQGWRAGAAPLVLFLNPDCEVPSDAVARLAAVLGDRSDVGIVAPRTRYPDGSIQVSTGRDLTPFSEVAQRRLVRGVRRRDTRSLALAERRHAREHEPDWVSGACLLARREVLEAIGGFDEGFFLYEEDADLCRRARAAGWRVLFTPQVEVRHRLGTSMARDPARARLEYQRSHLRYYEKHAPYPARLVLRASLLCEGFAGLARSRGEARDLLRLGLLGRR